MTDKDLRAKIIAFNKARLKDREMAVDLQSIFGRFRLIPAPILKALRKDKIIGALIKKYIDAVVPDNPDDTKGPSGLLDEEGV